MAEAVLVASAPREGAGLPPEWTDDPKTALGAAKITVAIDEDRNARGTLEGPLSLQIRGFMDDLVLRVELQSAPAPEPSIAEAGATTPSDEMGSPRLRAAHERSFRGTLVAAPAAQAVDSAAGPTPVPAIPAPRELQDLPPPHVLNGTLRLSSGDSLLVRRADVSLSRALTTSPSNPPH